MIAGIEQHSEHPLGAALLRAARERHVAPRVAEAFLSVPGRGAQAQIDGRSLWAGGPRLASERAGALPPPELHALHERGETAIALGDENRVLGPFGGQDRCA